MADYKLVDTREIMGVKKCIYKKPGSQKQYCKYDGRMMNIANFRKMKKNKLLAKKPRKPLKARRGGENDMDDSYNYESDSDNDYAVEDHSIMGGKKTSRKGGEADDHSMMGGKKTSKKGGEAEDHSMMGGKKRSKKGGVADFHTPRIGLNDFSLFTDSINNTFNNGLKQITGGKNQKRGGGNNIVMEGGRKSNREGGEYNIL